MRNRQPGIGLLILAALAGCRPAEDAAPAAPVVEEIPVTTSSTDALADFHAGRRAMEVGRRQQAKALFESAVARDPSFAYAYLHLAKTSESTQQFHHNLQLAMGSLEGKSEGERLLVEIYRTFFDNDAEKRMQLALELVEKYPQSPRAWLTLAGMQSGLNQHEAARESISRALELDPRMMAAHLSLYDSYLFNEPRDFARAEEAVWKCLEIDPEEAKLHESLGDVYRAMQQLSKARESYTRAIEMDPSLSVPHIKKGHVNSFLGNFEEARADYDAGLEGAEGTDRIDYANYRAFTHLHAGDPRGALDELAGLITAADRLGVPEEEVYGVKIFTLTNAAVIALHHGLSDDAEQVLAERAVLMRANAGSIDNPDFRRKVEADILLWEAFLAAGKGDHESARSKAEEHRALLESDRNPRRLEGYYGLQGLIELRQGNDAEAARQLRKSDPKELYFKYLLALAEEGAGNQETARQLFKEVAEWNFNSVAFALVRQDAMERMG